MGFVRILFNALRIVILVDAAMTWLKVRPTEFPRSLTSPWLEPVYGPIRHALSGVTGPIDLSPLVVLAVLYGVQALIDRGVRKDGT